MTVTLAARLGLGLGLGPGVTEAEGPEVNLVTVPSGTLGHCYIALFLAIYHLGYIAPAKLLYSKGAIFIFCYIAT